MAWITKSRRLFSELTLSLVSNFFFLNNLFRDYKEYNTDTTVRFVISMSPDKLDKAEDEGLHKVFKVQSSLSINSMVSTNQRFFRLICILSGFSVPLTEMVSYGDLKQLFQF